MTTLPMFPLGSALVPGMLLPLHVFEQRYRELVRDVVQGDGLFGVVLITHGHEVGGGDQRADIGTIAQVVDTREYEDGRWGIVAVGRTRFRVSQWLPDDPYARAVVVDWPDEHGVEDGQPEPDADLEAIEQRLLTVVDLATRLGVDVDYPELAEEPATAVWQAAFTAALGPQDIHGLLTCPGLAQRLPRLAALLDERIDVLRFRLEAQSG